MLDYSENSCYLKVVRPPTKSVQHCTTGRCQIERVSFQNKHSDLEYSIKHSKMLQAYKDKYPYSTPFIQAQCEEVFVAKNIHEDKSKYYIGKTLKQLHCALYSENYIQKLKQEKYNTKKQQHENQLLQIWKNLKPDEKLTARCSDQWISIGFQANDPATDFRGAGILGLKNLHSFTQKPQCIQIFKVASTPQTQYFFCSAGLFFTMLASDLLKHRKLSLDFWVHKDQQQILHKFQMLYQMLFKQFTKFWLQKCENKSIMFFNHNLKSFEKEIKNWCPKVLKAHIEGSLSQ